MDEVGRVNDTKESGGCATEELPSSSAAAAALGFVWRPSQRVFSPYETVNKAQTLRVVVRKPVSVLASSFSCKSLQLHSHCAC